MEGAAKSSQSTLIVIDDDEINRGILENLFSPVYAVEEMCIRDRFFAEASCYRNKKERFCESERRYMKMTGAVYAEIG